MSERQSGLLTRREFLSAAGIAAATGLAVSLVPNIPFAGRFTPDQEIPVGSDGEGLLWGGHEMGAQGLGLLTGTEWAKEAEVDQRIVEGVRKFVEGRGLQANLPHYLRVNGEVGSCVIPMYFQGEGESEKLVSVWAKDQDGKLIAPNSSLVDFSNFVGIDLKYIYRPEHSAFMIGPFAETDYKDPIAAREKMLFLVSNKIASELHLPMSDVKPGTSVPLNRSTIAFLGTFGQ